MVPSPLRCLRPAATYRVLSYTSPNVGVFVAFTARCADDVDVRRQQIVFLGESCKQPARRFRFDLTAQCRAKSAPAWDNKARQHLSADLAGSRRSSGNAHAQSK